MKIHKYLKISIPIYFAICLYVHMNTDYSGGSITSLNDLADFLMIIYVFGGLFGTSALIAVPLLLLDKGDSGWGFILSGITFWVVAGIHLFIGSILLNQYDSTGTIRYLLSFSPIIVALLLVDENGNFRQKRKQNKLNQ